MAVVVTSWILTLLTLLVLSVSDEVRLEIKLTQLERDELHSRALALSGVTFATDLLLRTGENEWDAPNESWDQNPSLRQLALGRGWFSLGYAAGQGDSTKSVYGLEDEERKLPLWLADQLGLELLPGFTPTGVQAVLEFLTDHQPNSMLDPETIPGLDESSRAAAARYLTPYGTGVNINTASPEVLLALGIPLDGVASLLVRRDGPDGVQGTWDDRPFESVIVPTGGLRDCHLSDESAAVISYLARADLLLVRSEHFRARSRGWVQGARTYYEVDTVLRRSSQGTIETVSWREARHP